MHGHCIEALEGVALDVCKCMGNVLLNHHIACVHQDQPPCLPQRTLPSIITSANKPRPGSLTATEPLALCFVYSQEGNCALVLPDMAVPINHLVLQCTGSQCRARGTRGFKPWSAGKTAGTQLSRLCCGSYAFVMRAASSPVLLFTVGLMGCAASCLCCFVWCTVLLASCLC